LTEHGHSSRGEALREGLPYGVVMATAGASALAGRCGLPVLVMPLLALAVLQALEIAIIGGFKYRGEFRAGWRAWLAIGPANEHTGIHTVPLGLAVIAGGLAGQGGGWLMPLAGACLGLAWLLALVCVARFLWSLAARRLRLKELDGAWFLVPAALLGAAVATVKIISHMTGPGAAALSALALAGAVTGWLGYWAVAVPAALRVKRFGLGAGPRAPWWIAMGCAGLAAAALGSLLNSSLPWGSALQAGLAAMLATAVCAVTLSVPVLVASADFLLRRCRFQGGAAWPPTFSTAVFALGCLHAGAVLHSPAFHGLGIGAGFATLALWTATAAWNAKRIAATSLRLMSGLSG
jgi:hypothetical protein